ncbi:hypothetical protein TRIP_C20011 [Candidatus Zixiibacteriota bacterium]|nr:hypothetical protein TRIP_C20011 [candidate division Zixibacteria bacterium]
MIRPYGSSGIIESSNSKPKSGIYDFRKLLSNNQLTQSWFAINTEQKQPCFVKAYYQHKDNSINGNQILEQSFELQKFIKTSQIHTSSKLTSDNGFTLIEYPYLDPKEWRALRPELFLSQFPDVLSEIFKIIDYLHLNELVHCDLKLENFLVSWAGPTIKVKLIDLDFLTKSHSRPSHHIIGTPGKIAPEILDDEMVFIESDNYSIGLSLESYIKNTVAITNLISTDVRDKLTHLICRLTASSRFQRSAFLIPELYNSGIIDKKAFDRIQRDLFAMKFVSDYHRQIDQLSGKSDFIKYFLSPSNGVFGISEELVEFLDVEAQTGFFYAYKLFKELLRSSEINRYGNFWHLNIPDVVAWNAINRINSFTKHVDLRGLLGGRKKVSNSYVTFLHLKYGFATNGISEEPNREQLRNLVPSTLARIALSLGRFSEADGFYNTAINAIPNNCLEKCRLIYDLSHVYLLLGKTDDFLKAIHEGKALSKELRAEKYYLIFRRQEAWHIGATGDIIKANSILSDLLAEALQKHWKDEASKILASRGALLWRSGDFNNALGLFKKSLSLSKSHGNALDQIINYSNLAVLYFELADYTKSIKYGKVAVELALKTNQLTRIPALYINLMLGYTRIADYKQSEFWLNGYLTGRTLGLDRSFFLIYYLYYANLLFKEGQFVSAKEAFRLALSMRSSNTAERNVGKLYQSEALLYFQEANKNEFNCAIANARKIFAELGDTASITEVNFINSLWAIYVDNQNEIEYLPDYFQTLIKGNNRYYAALCLFYILLYGNPAAKRRSISDSSKINFIRSATDVPLFRAVSELIQGSNAKITDISDLLPFIKDAYSALYNSGDQFNALLVCMEIADIYKSVNNYKLARKFYQQAYSLAQGIKNNELLNAANKRLQEIPKQELSRSQFVNSIRAVSKILDNIEDKEASILKLVNYAVKETGAERGVLLLRADEYSKLQVKAYANCDVKCLDDIAEFSNSIANTVATQEIPLLIDNAMEDSLTNKYKSILTHNILSVICVPIKSDNELQGVLYLDHHTIPALFDTDDVTFIHAMASFISILWQTVFNYSIKNMVGRQLAEDMAKLGSSKTFITQNEKIRKMLLKLPDISRSNASVLLIGESGTGKEIVTQMIHDMSRRAKGPLVKLNCAAIQSSMFESELFGVAKRVATGVDERPGKLAAADGGTLFFDEIGDMPLEMQSKILRVIEYQRFEKVGSNRSLATDIRFIYATNKNLTKLIQQGKFREDLYYRINTVTINIPSLSERCDDIPLLLQHFLEIYSPDKNERPIFTTSALNALIAYSWPGNVRELRNVVERACIYYCRKNVDLGDLPAEIREFIPPGTDSIKHKENIEKTTILKALNENNWIQSAAARNLHIPLTTLRRKIEKYKISKSI